MFCILTIMETFAEILTVGGETNSLGRSNEVLARVLDDETLLKPLYECLFDKDAWVRMRAADTIEKVCREQPSWLLPYIDMMLKDLHQSEQPSIQWHLAQIYRQVTLTDAQKATVIAWLKELLSSSDVDWIVAANAMDTLVKFMHEGLIPQTECRALIEIQMHHKSKSVVRRATKLLKELSG